MKQMLLLLCRMMHEMQKERSLIVLYLCSSREEEEENIRKQFLDSNHASDELTAKIPFWTEKGLLDSRSRQKLASINKGISNLASQRTSVLNKATVVADYLSEYSHRIIEPVIDLMIEMALSDPKNDSARVSVFSNLLNFNEKICRGFDHCAKGLSIGNIKKSNLSEKFKALMTEQINYKDTFMALAKPDQKRIFDRYMNISTNSKIDVYSSLDWFEKSSEFMNQAYETISLLIGTLEDEDNGSQNKSPAKNVRNENGSLTRISAFTKKQQEFVHTLPLFKGLSDHILEELFKSATISRSKKGKLLFLEGDVPDKLYIILDGWVKLYKGNSSGEETIVQMLSSGDMVAESAVFLNAPFPVNAQVAKEARILTLPAANIRHLINSNNEFAVNVLTAMSVHSQMLMQGLESIRLKSATERVGWFLLKLLLEQGRVPDMVELPYDKSLIASYLDMKPETFSRTLKKFKQKGFEIRKDAVILPQVKALCGFCDSSISTICSRHGTPECPNPDCISSKDEIVFYD